MFDHETLENQSCVRYQWWLMVSVCFFCSLWLLFSSYFYTTIYFWLSYSFNKLKSRIQRGIISFTCQQNWHICDWWLGWSDIKPIDQLFVYFVALELWPWSYAWPWPLYVMHLGRHGQLPSLILVTFHMFDSDFNHIFSICLSNALNFHYLKIKFGCPTCTDKTVYCSPAQSCWSLQAPETPAMLLGQGWFEYICCVLFWGAGDRKTQ